MALGSSRRPRWPGTSPRAGPRRQTPRPGSAPGARDRPRRGDRRQTRRGRAGPCVNVTLTDGAVGREQHAVAGASLVVAAGVHPIGPPCQLPVHDGPVVGRAALEIGCLDQRSAVAAVGVRDAQVLDHGARARVHREDQRRAIGIVGLLNACDSPSACGYPRSRNARVSASVAPPACAARGVGPNSSTTSRRRSASVHAERALELHTVDRVRRHQHVADQHTTGRRLLLKDAHVLEGVETDEVGDRFAHVAHRQRLCRRSSREGSG